MFSNGIDCIYSLLLRVYIRLHEINSWSITMFHVPNQYRFSDKNHYLYTEDSDGNYGAFIIPYESYEFTVIASEGMGWEHVSITPTSRKRAPSWVEMCFFKDLFWDKEDCVVQFHPPESEYVNNHEYCLHLWRKIGSEFPLPPTILVGEK